MRTSASFVALACLVGFAPLLEDVARADMPDLAAPNASRMAQDSHFDPEVRPVTVLLGPSGEVHGPDPLLSAAPAAEPQRDWSLSLCYGYETFRGIADGNWQNNGLYTGFNFGTRLGALSDATGIGMQLGGIIGVYNWSGDDYRISDNDQAETQGFLTMGFFRKACAESPWSAGLVFDWMLNNNFSVFNASPTLNQFRYQLGYDVNDANEIGVWGTVHGQSATQSVAFFGPVTWQAVDQISVFSHHKWPFGADTSLWVGAPLSYRLDGGGAFGTFIAGARGETPLSDWMGLYMQVTYMRPAIGPGPAAAEHDEWSFVIGLTIYPRRDSRTPTVAREGWAALMPVASNGVFFTDASKSY